MYRRPPRSTPLYSSQRQSCIRDSGTVILREWDEREHRVTVNAHGQFEYEGQGFKSLTAVARHITGTHWSGPAFFGLTKGAQ